MSLFHLGVLGTLIFLAIGHALFVLFRRLQLGAPLSRQLRLVRAAVSTGKGYDFALEFMWRHRRDDGALISEIVEEMLETAEKGRTLFLAKYPTWLSRLCRERSRFQYVTFVIQLTFLLMSIELLDSSAVAMETNFLITWAVGTTMAYWTACCLWEVAMFLRNPAHELREFCRMTGVILNDMEHRNRPTRAHLVPKGALRGSTPIVVRIKGKRNNETT